MPEKNAEHIDKSKIQGWGADRNPSSRPAVPMERKPPRYTDPNIPAPEQQIEKVEVFHSIERPAITPIFGTTLPPRGLSGMIRRAAFGLSENDIRHWLMLLFADRVDVVEGIIEDFSRGHIPNIFAEMGIKAEWKYNKIGLMKKAAIATGIVAGIGFFLAARRSQKAELA